MLATVAAADSASTVRKKYSVFIYSEAEPHAIYAIYKQTLTLCVLRYIIKGILQMGMPYIYMYLDVVKIIGWKLQIRLIYYSDKKAFCQSLWKRVSFHIIDHRRVFLVACTDRLWINPTIKTIITNGCNRSILGFW